MPTSSPINSGAKQITILGAGAIGQLIFHQLSNGLPELTTAPTSPQAKSLNPKSLSHKPEYELSFISREAHSHVQPVSFTALDGQKLTRSAQFIGQDDYRQSLTRTTLLIVCVKAYQVTAAVTAVLPYLPNNTHILLLHNGMGPHLDVKPYLGKRGLSLGTTSQGALKLAKWHVKQTGAGLTQLGSYKAPTLDCEQSTEPNSEKNAELEPEKSAELSADRRTELSTELKAILLSTIPQSRWYDDILPLLWQKLAINVAINPLTAIHSCPNGQLANLEYRDTIFNAVSELVKVASADGINLDLEYLLDRVYQVIELTAQNYSSMQQDVSHQRATEINAINGFVLERAKLHKLNVPYNQSLVDQVKQCEAAYQG
ncbi:ketopantoate reductase family protein [Shewanella sp. 30m-9]